MENSEKLVRLITKGQEIVKETRVLYEISDAEMLYMTHIVVESSNLGLEAKSVAKLLKAAAHYIEASDDAAKDLAKALFKEE